MPSWQAGCAGGRDAETLVPAYATEGAENWEDLAAWDGAPIGQPSLFIAGERDASTGWLADAIAAHARTLPALSANHLLPGCGHWVQQERPDEVNRLLIDWLDALPAV